MRKVGFLFLTAICLIACEKTSSDETPPAIVRYQLMADTVLPQDMLTVNVIVRDNEDLNQMRFRIKEAFAKSFSPWSEIRIIDIQGFEHEGAYTFEVPDSAAAGMYEIGFQVADFQGNGSIDSLITFFVEQPGMQPVFDGVATVPAADADNVIIVILDSDTMSFSGIVSDENGLERVTFEFKSARGSNLRSSNYTFGDSLVTLWNLALADSVFFGNDSQLPVELVIKAINSEGNQSRRRFGLSFFD